MKVVAFNGSPRKGGNTAILIRHIFNELEKEGIETELVELADKAIHGCVACQKCFKNKDQRCSVTDDAANEYIAKMLGADGIILGSPVYFQDVTPEMKALIDRAGYVSSANGRMFERKVGASVVAARRSGAICSLDTMDHFFLAGKIVIVGRALGSGLEKGDVEKDNEGIALAKSLGKNMAWVLKKLHD
ncbi:MAG TPA: flavodoxin family protein [Syntrophales bacterium]|nr:flavodoxin family protein [Syntrophales bacterium]HPQ42664.1 flavodoxin family protein [Syntrophales bacterium]